MLAQTQTHRDDLRRVQRADFSKRDEGIGSFSRWVPIPHTHTALTDVVHESIRQLAAKAINEERSALSEDRERVRVDYLKLVKELRRARLIEGDVR